MQVLGSPIFTIIFIIVFGVFLFRYWNLLKTFSLRFRVLLFSLRAITITILLILLLNPWIKVKRQKQLPQNVAVLFDHSESLKHHYEMENLQPEQIKNKIYNWGFTNNVEINFYRLGKKIKPLVNMDIYNMVTDFSQLPEFLSYELPNQLLFITDGKVTSGRELNDLNIPNTIPIHVLGVGPLKMVNDLIIKGINVPYQSMQGDTVDIVLKLESHLDQQVTTKLHIQNDSAQYIYDGTLHFGSGNQSYEINISIPATQFSGLNKAILHPVEEELKIENNQYTFKVNVQSTEEIILMISGALSSNTVTIKSTLNTLEGLNVLHCFKMYDMHWNEEPSQFLTDHPKMIVLDNFPIGENDLTLFDKIYNESNKYQVPIVYIEGPNSNLLSAEIIRVRFPSFTISAIDSEIPTDLSDESKNIGAFGVNLSDFPPQRRSVKWAKTKESWINYSDGSFMIASQNNLFMMVSPEIAKNHLKTSNNLTSSISNLMRNMFLHAYNKSNGFLNLHLDEILLNKGEIVHAILIPTHSFGLSDISIMVINPNEDTLFQNCNKDIFTGKYNYTQVMQISGEYTFQAEAILGNGNKVLSNVVKTVVQDENVELKDLTQDQNTLMRVAHNSGGKYMGIESLDSMFSYIEIMPIQLIKKYQVNGLSIQHYWWMLILLLAVEWFLRKKLGLL